MEFAFTQEQELVQENVGRFAREKLLPHYSRWDRGEEIKAADIREAAERGIFRARIPDKYGGQHVDFVTFGIMSEALALGDFNYTLFLQLSMMISEILVSYALPDVQKEWLPQIATGQTILALALTEPQAGSDVAKITASAKRSGDGRVFSAGVDIKAIGKTKLENGAVGLILDLPARALIDAIQTVSKAVIAKVNGFCFTGALELELPCDLMIVAAGAKFADTHAKWGLRPTWVMSARLPSAVGLRKARELSFTADAFTGEEAAEMGLANRCVPDGDFVSTVRALALKIAANSPDSIAAYKVLYDQGLGKTVSEAVRFENTSTFPISHTGQRLAKFR